MIKFKNKIQQEGYLDFDDLNYGDTFIWSLDKNCQKYLGMKIKDAYDAPLILDLSDSIGECFNDTENYIITELVDLEIEILKENKRYVEV